jgi:signal transduction histidine kinase
MYKWIRENKWLPSIALAGTCFLLFGGVDLSVIGPLALIPAAAYTAALVFARAIPLLAIALIPVGEAFQVWLGLPPVFSSLAIPLVLMLVAAFAKRSLRILALIVVLAGSVVVTWLLAYGPSATFADLGLRVDQQQLPLAIATSVLLSGGWQALAWFVGRLIYVRVEHVGSPLDRAFTLLSQARLNFELARQNERLDIVRDLSELLIQRVGAVRELVEGGAYAVRQDPGVATRVLERAGEAAKSAQVELRRLFDLLHESEITGGIAPSLADIDALVVAYRELGFNAELRLEGKPFDLDEGAELCLYRIVFEALQNVRKHAPLGSSISIEFTWVDPGLQLMIKDNGIEQSNRIEAGLNEILEGYTVAEDVQALIGQIEGSTLSVLRERAALYEGSVEASVQPGVGFTVSAIFPNLRLVVQGR